MVVYNSGSAPAINFVHWAFHPSMHKRHSIAAPPTASTWLQPFVTPLLECKKNGCSAPDACLDRGHFYRPVPSSTIPLTNHSILLFPWSTIHSTIMSCKNDCRSSRAHPTYYMTNITMVVLLVSVGVVMAFSGWRFVFGELRAGKHTQKTPIAHKDK